MNAIELLKQQHREVEELFSKIEKGGEGPARERRALVAELTEKIKIHTNIEEKIFYPEGRQANEDLTLEAYVEHDVVSSLLRKISKTRLSDENFDARITVLKELIEHHVQEEEQEYFPQCEKKLGNELLEELGERMEAAVQKLEGAPRKKRHLRVAA